MNTEETKCGDDCKLVEMLATKTPKEQAMDNAIAAAQTKKMTVYGAAKTFKVSETTLQRRLKKVATTQVGVVTTEPEPEKVATNQVGVVATEPEPESESTKQEPADKAERDQWWADHQAGLSVRKIAEKHKRARKTITNEITRREVAAFQSEPTPAPAPTPTPSAPQPAPASAPEPAPSVPSAGSSEPFQWADHPRLKGWNGSLNDRGQKIYNREVRSSRSRVRMAEQLAEFKVEIEKSMKAASNNHRNGGGWALLEADVAMVEATLQREKRPGIKETLEAVMHEAERIQKYASETLRVLQLTETLTP